MSTVLVFATYLQQLRYLGPIGMLKYLRAFTTARDNKTPSLMRVAVLAAGLEWFILVPLDAFGIVKFNMEAFALGTSGLFTAFAFALRWTLPTNQGNDGWGLASTTPPYSEDERG